MVFRTIKSRGAGTLHLARSNPFQMTPTQYTCETYCGREMTGAVTEHESLTEFLVCKTCQVSMKRTADLRAAMVERDKAYAAGEIEAPVLSTPETIREPETGRQRHGRIRYERSERRRRMKELASANA